MTATDTESLGWLADHVGDDDSKYVMLKRPFSVAVGSKSFACATDGKALIAVEQSGEWPFAGVPEGEFAKAMPCLEAKPAGQPVDVGALRVWCGLPADKPCEFCGDKREADCQGCLGSGDSHGECEACGHPHKCRCRYCEGSKTERCPCCPGKNHDAPGWLGGISGVLVDRIRLGRMLDVHLARGEVLVELVPHLNDHLDSTRAHFYGPGWRAVLMGMVPHNTPGEHPGFMLGAVGS